MLNSETGTDVDDGLSASPPTAVNDAVTPRPWEVRSSRDRWAGIFFLAGLLFLTLCYWTARTAYASSGIPDAWCVAGLLLLYPLFLLESFLVPRPHMDPRRRRWQMLFPPLMLAARDQSGERIWLPIMGWTPADDRLFLRIEQFVTLFLLGGAVVMGSLTAHAFSTGGGLDALSVSPAYQTGMLVIWLVVVAELILLESMARMKGRFYNTHRVNLVVAFTPMLPLLRAALLIRIVRGIFLFETFQRVVHRGRKNRLAALELELAVKEEELARLKEKIQLERDALRGASASGES